MKKKDKKINKKTAAAAAAAAVVKRYKIKILFLYSHSFINRFLIFLKAILNNLNWKKRQNDHI